MAFEEIMNEFIILLRPSPIVQDSLILNSRNAGMLTIRLSESVWVCGKRYPDNPVNPVKKE